MFTKLINGKLYRLIKIPDDTTQIEVTPDQDNDYVWLHCNTHIRKRVKLDLKDWQIIGVVGNLPYTAPYNIGMKDLSNFIHESGMAENNALLLVKDSNFGNEE